MSMIKVVIVEDSKMMQKVLSSILSSDPGIIVVGVAADPYAARDLIKKTNPNVITLDVMLPQMDGITFLKNLMRLRPIPTVMISSLTEAGGGVAMDALALGAFDYIPKPTQADMADLSRFEAEVISTVKQAANSKVVAISAITAAKKLESIAYKSEFLKKEIIAIGASTGGIEAIESILLQLPRTLPPIVIVQHIRKEFSNSFAQRLKKLYGFNVVQPEHYAELMPAHIYVAKSDHHLIVKKDAKNHYVSSLRDTPPVNGHKPSIDKLFNSIAECAKGDCMGILLTGMGNDGAEGLMAMKVAGGVTLVQDEKTSVVWGMPGAAVKLKAVDYIVPIEKIPEKMLEILDQKASIKRK